LQSALRPRPRFDLDPEDVEVQLKPSFDDYDDGDDDEEGRGAGGGGYVGGRRYRSSAGRLKGSGLASVLSQGMATLGEKLSKISQTLVLVFKFTILVCF
jgi:hypothetical protein